MARAAYTVVDKTIIPKATEEEGEAIKKAFADISAHGLNGARTHLRTAAERLNEGNYADSIRESIHAVEAVARILDPTASSTLDPALNVLERKAGLNRVLKSGFSKIYNYTNAEGGLRHALIETDEAAVDETDALFMIGACASFISYLIGKAEGAGIGVR
jgi:hypothetical protein